MSGDPVLGLREALQRCVDFLRAPSATTGCPECCSFGACFPDCPRGYVIADAEAALAAHDAERNPASRLDALIASLPPAPDVEEIDAECLDPRMFDWEELRDG